MFDTVTPGGGKKEIVDIFEGVNTGGGAPAAPAAAPTTAPAPVRQKRRGIVRALLSVVIILALAGAGVYAYFTFFRQPSSAPATPTPVSPAPTVQQPTVPEPVPTVQTPTTPTPTPAEPTPQLPPLDTDNDGLSDGREQQLGTDINRADTDGDGLLDGEEVDVYRTNPLNPDTDGDSYVDGEEVRNGYNPNGPGLFTPAPSI